MPNRRIDPYRLTLYERKLYAGGTWISGYHEEDYEVGTDRAGRHAGGICMDTCECERTSEGSVSDPVVGGD